ncbi:Abi-alpha family protein [Clostridium celatum]|uniref:Abi-alpha family protein n=1 Tax=Clostridium celatum TaxID=36834 RepID=UPI0018998225
MIKINSGIDTLLEAAGKTLETAPKLYDDLFQPAAKQVGKTLELIPRSINAALSPAWNWVIHREYNMAETEKLLSEKLKNVDPNKIVQPEPYVAVPALQAISYSMNNDVLRNLYANLIAKSMNIDTKDTVHPSFVEIIKQLSPLDAKLFDILCKNVSNPIIDLKRKEKNNSGSIALVNNICNINIATVESLSVSIDNLERLKLISIPYGTYYVDDDLYAPFYDHEIYKQYKEMYGQTDSYELDITKKLIFITDMGKSFHKICVNN